jgi:hypothetical protein
MPIDSSLPTGIKGWEGMAREIALEIASQIYSE